MSRISAAVSALVSILDKTVIYRYVRSPLTLPLLIGILQTGFGLAVLIIVRVPSDATWGATGAALLSGMLYGINGQLVLRSPLYAESVSYRTRDPGRPYLRCHIGPHFLERVHLGRG